MVMIGRLAVAVLPVWVPARRIYLTLPVFLLLAFVGIPQVSGPVGNLVAFGFAGLACSALLPLSIKSAPVSRGRCSSARFSCWSWGSPPYPTPWRSSRGTVGASLFDGGCLCHDAT